LVVPEDYDAEDTATVFAYSTMHGNLTISAAGEKSEQYGFTARMVILLVQKSYCKRQRGALLKPSLNMITKNDRRAIEFFITRLATKRF
jgi:hypothetical protein